MREVTKDRVLEVLARHIGRDAGVHVRTLTAEVTLGPADSADERRVRKAIEELRLAGAHICGTTRHGYFMADTPEELDACCVWLYSRAMKTLTQIAAMKKVSLPDLRGQLHLPT